MTPEPEDILSRHFGHSAFRPGQSEAIDAVIEGRDVVAVMPTGSGKSLLYQVPALVRDGPAVVVSPLIALMKDQVDALTAAGIAATFINSSIEPDERNRRVEGLISGRWDLVYIAPERLRSPNFRRALSRVRLGLLAIDEAHCISSWGHDFRPDYLRLGDLVKVARPAPVVACTATATPEVQADIVRRLQLSDPLVLVRGFRRDNLFLSVQRVGGAEEKLELAERHLRDALGAGIGAAAEGRQDGSGLVYCSTRKRAEDVAAKLRMRGVSAEAYHAGIDKDERRAVQERFMGGRTRCVVATNAFGMGVDKAAVRIVIHHDLPASPEAYYQEVGRAGRDGRPARCVLFFNHSDLHVRRFLIDASNPPREVVQEVFDQVLEQSDRSGGVVELSVGALADLCPSAKGQRQVGAALLALERGGALERGEPGAGRAKLRLLGDAGSVDFAAMKARSDREHDKLRRMVIYCTGVQCRHRFILEHFGDADSSECGDSCDICVGGVSEGRQGSPGVGGLGPASGEDVALGEEQVLSVRKALSAVARLRGRFGLGRVASVLTGGREQKLIEAGLDRLPTYGALSGWRKADVLILLEALIAVGCCEVRGGEYPTVSLTPLGAEVMRANQPVSMGWPMAAPGSARRGAGRKAHKSGARPAADEGPPLTADELDLFDRLKLLRRGLADERSVPAYVVATDRTLIDMVRLRPRDDAELLLVHGIGPQKVERYGPDFLAAVRG